MLVLFLTSQPANQPTNRWNRVIEKKDLEQTLEQAFEHSTEPPPEERYFEKIWNSIEVKAPVGEKYYLRFAFSILFFMLFCIIFVFFYSDFLSSVLTLKEIRKENVAYFSSATMPLVPSVQPHDAIFTASIEMVPGIMVDIIKKSSIRVKRKNEHVVELEFVRGHAVVKKRDGPRELIIALPDLTLRFKQGDCNIFCYDGIIRIIPLNIPITVETGSKREILPAGKIFYLLNKKPLTL